jgi:hypothetical protein
MRKYKITVAYRGKHLFTTDHINDPYNGGSDEFAARQLYDTTCRHYPAEQGYFVELSYVETIGHVVATREATRG